MTTTTKQNKPPLDVVMLALNASGLATVGAVTALYLASDRVAWFLLGASIGSLVMRTAHRRDAKTRRELLN